MQLLDKMDCSGVHIPEAYCKVKVYKLDYLPEYKEKLSTINGSFMLYVNHNC